MATLRKSIALLLSQNEDGKNSNFIMALLSDQLPEGDVTADIKYSTIDGVYI